MKLDAQVLVTVLSVYATNATLDDTGVAASYGFLVSGDGVGTAGVVVKRKDANSVYSAINDARNIN